MPHNDAYYAKALYDADIAYKHYKDVCDGIKHNRLSKETANPALNNVISTCWRLKEIAMEPPAAPLARKTAKEPTIKASKRKGVKASDVAPQSNTTQESSDADKNTTDSR